MPFEIDFLPVGKSSGDAILLRYGNPLTGYTVHLTDGAYPAVIAAVPVLAFAALFVPWTSFGLPQAIGAGTMAILLAAASDVARRRGVAIEPGIIQRIVACPASP